MSWETRANNLYYYRSFRIPGGQVRKQYFGCGASAIQAAEEDDRKRRRELEIRRQLTEERRRTATAEPLTTQLNDESSTLLSATLLAAGYHRVNYGPWRRSRTMIASNLAAPGEKQRTKSMTDKEARSRVRELVAKAESGETTAVVEIRQLLADHPEIFRRLGDVASCAHKAWINVIAGKNVELREMLIHRVGDLKRQLRVESTDTAITCLVIDQVVGTWLQLYHAEMRDAIDSAPSLKVAEFRLKQLESAHRRHLKGIAALATLQRLLPQASGDASGVIGEESNHTKHGHNRLVSNVEMRDEETSPFQLCPS